MNKLQKNIRLNILKLANISKEGHIPSSFSVIEILISIFEYYKKNHPDYNSIEIIKNVVLSKGHASFGLYATMLEYGVIEKSEFDNICQNGSKFFGHLPYMPKIGLEFGTGSLGHGLPYVIGKSFADFLKNTDNLRFCIIGDGEANEGTFWESLLLIRKFPKINLVIFIDNNFSSERAIPISDIFKLIENFNIPVLNVDGHDIPSLIYEIEHKSTGPLILVAKTRKGEPIKEMIGNPVWHHKTPNEKDIERFDNELNTYYA